jgi:hypothetical protein
MIEPEISFATLAEDMALAEDYLKFCTQWVLDHCAEDLAFFEATFEKGLMARLRNVVAEPFKVLTYTEAIELLSAPEHQAAARPAPANPLDIDAARAEAKRQLKVSAREEYLETGDALELLQRALPALRADHAFLANQIDELLTQSERDERVDTDDLVTLLNALATLPAPKRSPFGDKVSFTVVGDPPAEKPARGARGATASTASTAEKDAKIAAALQAGVKDALSDLFG